MPSAKDTIIAQLKKPLADKRDDLKVFYKEVATDEQALEEIILTIPTSDRLDFEHFYYMDLVEICDNMNCNLLNNNK